MSLYDDATLICLAKGAAGKDGVVYNIKPEEKLKPTELLANGGFDNTDDWALDPGGEVSISGGKLVFTDAVGNDYRRAKSAAAVFEDGKKYKISFTVTDFVRSSTSIKLKVQEDDNKTIIDVEGNGNFSAIYEGQATEEIQFKVSAPTTDTLSCKVDNVSVKEVEQEALDFTFTRGSNLTATRVAPSGYIERGRENIFTHSNAFDDDDWSKATATVTSGQSGYDGTTNAWDLTKTSEFGGLEQTVSSDNVQTFSLYAKADSVDYMRLWVTGSKYAIYYLSGDGSVTAENGNIDAQIEKIGTDGWYRCSLTVDASVTLVKINPSANATAADLGTTGSIHIQNAQLEQGLVVTPYIDSKHVSGKAGILEDSPRFDYTGGGCPTWLGEPNRVNLAQYSEYVDGWNQNTADVALSPDVSPEGLKNAYRVSGNGTGSQAGISLTVTDGSTYTGSIYIKKVSGADTAKLIDTNLVSTTVDITTEWQRFEVTATKSGDTTGRLYVQVASASSDNVIDIYGAQLEEGSYSTSYIPNYGKSGGETRGTEQTDVSNLQSNGIITDTQGTFFMDLPDYSTTAVQWDLMSSNFYFALRAAFFANTMTVYKRVLNTQSNIRNINSSDVPSLATTKRRKLALSWNGTSLITSINGISFDDTIDSSIAPELDKIRRANWTSTKVSTDQLLVFDKQLTKEELNELTSIS